MARMVLGVFTSKDQADNAIDQLVDSGYNAKDISIIMKDADGGTREVTGVGSNIAEGAVSGATTGGIIGGIAGLLIGVGALAIPGIGALLIAGPVAAALGLTGAAATTLSGALTGALAGGLVGALVGLGVPEEDARMYEERIRTGAILIAVPVQAGREDEVRDILDSFGADQIRSVGSLTTTDQIRDDYQGASYLSEVSRSRRRR